MIPAHRPMVAGLYEDDEGIGKAIVSFLRKGLEEGIYDAVLVPLIVPAGDSYAYVLVKEAALLTNADPVPPVIPVSGAKALNALARRSTGLMKVAAVLRPCEARASVELAKIRQIDLEGITLISMDCPGCLPLEEFLRSSGEGRERFQNLLRTFDDEGVRPVCRMCASTGMLAGDIHFGYVGLRDKRCLVLAETSKGQDAMRRMGLDGSADTSSWEQSVGRLAARRASRRTEMLRAVGDRVTGAEELLRALGDCINCHNCMRVCPLCYCRTCGFDAQRLGRSADDIMRQAEARGALRLPADALLFHLARMAHVGLTCVSCGACEDACPASIPIAQILSYVGDRVQAAFGYLPGNDVGEPVPLIKIEAEEGRGGTSND